MTMGLSAVPASHMLYMLIFITGFVGTYLPAFLCIIIPYDSPFDHVGFYLRERVLEIIDCLLFWFVESRGVVYVPAVKNHTILGLHTHNWIQVSLFVFIGYNVITLFTCVIVLGLQKSVPNMLGPSNSDSIIEHSMGGKYVVYCANGMKHSINFIMTALMLLLTWVLYFGSHLNNSPKAKKVVEIGTQTCVSVLICSVFWLIKTCVTLSWEATAVYSRLSLDLLEGGNQLYFLGLINRHNNDIFNLLYDVARQEVAQDDKQAKKQEGKVSKDYKVKMQSCSDALSIHSVRKGNGCPALVEKMNIYWLKLVPIIMNRKSRLIKNPWFLFLAPFHNMLNYLDVHQRSESDSVDEWPKQEASRLNDQDENKDKVSFILRKLSRKVKEKVRNDLVMQDGSHGLYPTIHGVQKVAQYLLSARKVLSDDTYTSATLLNLEKDGKVQESLMKQLIDGENNENDEDHPPSKGPGKVEVKHNWDYLKAQLGTCSEEIELEIIKAWMDKARNKCLFLANTLSSAKEVVDCLNNIISSLLIAASLIMWLLLTGFATTKVFVLIASPLLAATFIFGDTCKSFFQGIMFVYVVHPFHIGDLCVIDEKMMEVRTIGIWKTTFYRVGTQGEVIFTNAELSTKNIVNHKTDFDWNDSVEIDVATLNSYQITRLRENIESHLQAQGQYFTRSCNAVTLLTAGSDIKLTITFRHHVKEKVSTYSECVQVKQKRLSMLVLHIHELWEKAKNEGLKTPSSH